MEALPTAPSPALPVIGAAPSERADARRNRRRILAAAERLFAQHGTAHVSMDAIAAAAGVGKGTLFRRFGDRAGLARALLDERECEFQEAFIRGPAPLGPGAPPVERLIAYGRGRLELIDVYEGLVLASESGSPGTRCGAAVYGVHHTHIAALVRAAGASPAEADQLADVVLASLSAELFRHWRHERGLSLEQIGSGFESLARRLFSASSC